MTTFDVSEDWHILIPSEPAVLWKTGEDLARLIGLLRGKAGLPDKNAVLVESSRDVPDETVPIILFNVEWGRDFANGFSWRLGKNRMEIFGESGRGLCNGVYDFLAALGVRWPQPGWEELPSPDAGAAGLYPLVSSSAYHPLETDPAKRRRLVITGETPLRSREQVILWAVRNRIDAVVLPLAIIARKKGLAKSVEEDRKQFLSMAKEYTLIIEAGGWELSFLVPRERFFFHRDVFRMDMGKRVKDCNFCPTNPDTISILKREAERLFRGNPKITVFHFWPDRKHESAWCSCPTCRAFTREEQNRIAVNTIADTLAEIAPKSCLSYYEKPGDSVKIPPRPNMFNLGILPGEAGAEGNGLFLAE
jgi:hypothetical protein